MGLGQTLLTIVVLMLLGTIIHSMNKTTLDSGFTKDVAEYRITGTSLGTSMLEQCNALAFDQKTDTIAVNTLSSLTAASALGPETGETVATFNDIDDYNNYVKMDTLPSSAIFKTTVKVEYVSIVGGAIVVSTTQTWSKRITVNVTSAFMTDYSVDPPRPDTLRFQSIFSYWYYR